MSSFYSIEPEVAGGWGPNTASHRAADGSRQVTQLHYVFDGWLGDELLETSPCFIVSERLAAALNESDLTGFICDEVEVTVSGQFREIYGDRKLPDFLWLKIVGQHELDDFGLTPDLQLVISDRALAVLRSGVITNAIVEPVA